MSLPPWEPRPGEPRQHPTDPNLGPPSPGSGPPQPPVPERPLSFSERYRGTEWGQTAAPLPAPAGGGGDGPRVLPIVIGVVLLAVVAGLGIYVFAGAATMPSTITRVALSPTAPGRQTATQVALDRFRKLTADEKLPYHVAYEGLVRSIGLQFQLKGDVDVVGENIAGDMTFRWMGQSATADVVIVDGAAYGRIKDVEGGWEKLDGFESTTPANVFPAIRAAEIEALDRATRGNRRLHQLRTTEWVGADPASIIGDPSVKASVARSNLDLYVEDDGTPVEGLLQSTLRFGDRDSIDVHMEVRYLFSAVGEPVEIVAPDID